MRHRGFGGFLAGSCLVSAPAAAQPSPDADAPALQANASLLLGPAVSSGQDGAFGDHVEFQLGLRGDLLFLRSRPDDLGLGPYVEVSTFAFNQGQLGGGASFLIPVHDAFPLVLSGGGHLRLAREDIGPRPGFDASLFWGARSFNYHGVYNMAGGLRVGYHHSFGITPADGPTVDEKLLSISAQVDVVALGLPIVLLIDALRGPSEDARPL